MSNPTPTHDGASAVGTILAHPCQPRAVRKPRILRHNKGGSRSLAGRILVFPRKGTDGKWMVMWRTHDGRRYRSFGTMGAADGFARELQRHRREVGEAAGDCILTPAEARLLQELRQATAGAKLSDIVVAWNDYHARRCGLDIGEIARRFLEMRNKEGAARSILSNDVLRLRRFVEKVGAGRAANTVTSEDVRRWVAGLLAYGYSPKTVHHHLRTLSMVFRRAIAEGWAVRNPCLAVVGPRIVPQEVSVLSLADAQRLFAANRGHRVALYMALEAFGGLRCASAIRVSPGDILHADRLIVLPAAKHKSGRRHVLEGLPDNLWEWLRQAESLNDANWLRRPWQISAQVYSREKQAAFARAGVDLRCNVLRHSFCSYHVAQHQDVARTAVLMQHANQSMIYRHYKGAVTRADAAGYFAITPA